MESEDLDSYQRITLYTTFVMNPTTTSIHQTRKIKKSFSISPESEAFIKKSSRERRIKSESETLDLLLRELIAVRQQHALNTAYQDYYDSLTDEESAENRAWGTFAEGQLAGLSG
jgi:hypothetical protein